MTGWPWPVDAIQNFLEDLWDWVSSAAVNAVSVVWGWINDFVDWLWTNISGAFSSLWSSVNRAFDWVWAKIAGGLSDLGGSVSKFFDWVWARIAEGLNSLWSSVSGALSSVWSQIVDAFSNLWTRVSAGLGDLWGSVSGAFSGLWTSISRGLGDLWKGFMEWGNTLVTSVTTMFNGAVSAIGGWVSQALAGVAKALGEALSGFISWLQGSFNTLVGWLVGGIQWLGAQLRSIFEAIATMVFAPIVEALKPGSPPEPLGEVTAAFSSSVMGKIVEECKRVSGSPIQREMALPAAVGVLSGITLMHSVGGVLTMAFDATHPVKEWGTQELFHRVALNLMSSPITSAILATPVMIGIIEPLRQYFNAMFKPEIPGSGDLIRFVVREVITPETFRAYMGYRGYDEVISSWYWDAHWELPAFAQLVDAYHRRVIDREELGKFVVWHDYSPTPRPGIAKSDLEIMAGLMKTLIPRVDLRRGYRIGRLSYDELVERYEDLGYEGDSRLEADIQVGMAFEAERNKLRDNAKEDFVLGFILEGVLRANLAEIGMGPDEVEYHVADARADRERRRKKALLGIYRDAYLKDLKTYEELEADVREIIVEEDALEEFLTEAYIGKYKKPKAG